MEEIEDNGEEVEDNGKGRQTRNAVLFASTLLQFYITYLLFPLFQHVVNSFKYIGMGILNSFL